MPRKKRQSFPFPGVEQAPATDTDRDLDALIDGGAKESTADRKIRDDAAKKKAVLDAAKSIPEIFKPEDVKFAFDVYVGLICFLFSLAYKCDFTALWEELKMDETTKEQLSKPLAKVFSKHAPSEWAGMTAEIECIAFFGMWTVAAMPRAKQVADREKLKKQNEARSGNRVTAVPPQRESPQREIVL